MFQTQTSKTFIIAALASVIAGVIYNSWPLGYLLNPLVSRSGLASELGAIGQPYNWVFIVLDIISGVLVVLVTVLLWNMSSKLMQKVVLANFALFGIMTALSAAIPMTCEPSLTSCPPLSRQPWLVVHGLASILASVCLFVSVCLVWWQKRQQTGAGVMSILLAGWTLFGVLSVYFFFVTGPGYLAQRYYITLCSVWMVLLPFMLDIVPKRRTR